MLEDIDPIARQMLPGFLKNRQADVKTLQTLRDEGNWSEIRRIGHNMKGAGGAFGVQRVSEIGAVIEEAALAENSEALSSQLEDLSGFVAACLQEIG